MARLTRLLSIAHLTWLPWVDTVDGPPRSLGRLLEGGGYRLLESGGYRLLEDGTTGYPVEDQEYIK